MTVWRALSKRERRFGIGMLLALLGFVAFRLFLAPNVVRVKALLDRQEEMETKYSHAKANLLIQESVIKAREAYEREISGQGSEQEEQSFLLREIERLGHDLPLRIRGMRPLPIEDKGSYKRFAVSMEIEGSVEHTLQFVHLIENSPRLLRVERLHLTADGKKRGQLSSRLLVSRPAVVSVSNGGQEATSGGKN
jgi:Tfp pilus assembly protein PilO